MSDDVVIRATGLGKKYMIGHESAPERYTTLRDVIGRSMRRLSRAARGVLRGEAIVHGEQLEEFWALKDVNFEIKRGEVVGIIGRNGAGKSTLLKIVSRITEPSEGRVEIRGRVASLLEVGTGFHPELTGRENIDLNGAILGMTRAEIRHKFEEIVAFAEVEKFLDTPVKRYSSGMYVRLAFAVAAHLEPEVLMVDEVLAVGDAEFQKKCLGKMQDVAGLGRTVLFVSHNMAAVQNLCSRGLVVRNGRIVQSGSIGLCVDSYGQSFEGAKESLEHRKDRQGSGNIRATAVRVLTVRNGMPRLSLELEYKQIREASDVRIVLAIYNSMNTCVLRFDSVDSAPKGQVRDERHCVVSCPENFTLAPGAYYINVAIFSAMELCDRVERAENFQARDFDFYGNGAALNTSQEVHVAHDWNFSKKQVAATVDRVS